MHSYRSLKSEWYIQNCTADFSGQIFNPLNTELNSICRLLALLVARHILHVRRIKVKKYMAFEKTFLIITNTCNLHKLQALGMSF
jgi:hypothetical protein